MRFTLPLILLALALPAHADSARKVSGTIRIAGPISGQQADPVRRFVESNITETLYHELGHALIDVLDLPVFGPEEFAVDRFAAVMIDRMHDEDQTVAITYDVAAAYDAGAIKERSAGDAPAMWDVHGTDRQRYYNLVCLIYGANPEERDDIAEELGLPDERMQTCDEEYEMTAGAWGAVLDDLAAEAPGTSLKMDWMLDAKNPITQYVTAEVARLNAVMSLPDEIAVSVIACDEVNAFYDPSKREIIICTEMADELAQLAR